MHFFGDPLKIDRSANKPTLGFSLPEIESFFCRSPGIDTDFFTFITDLLNRPPWNELIDPSAFYRTICLELAQEVQNHNKSMGLSEPAYHNRSHFQDVCMSLTLLLSQNVSSQNISSDWYFQSDDLWTLLLCAIGHDFGHDGSINKSPQELEKRSLEKINEVLKTCNLSSRKLKDVMRRMEPIILATDPAFFNTLANKFSSNLLKFNKTDCMCMLMVESDLLASALPNYGYTLSGLLAKEWKKSNPKAADLVASNDGRTGFLNYIRFISPHSNMLGMEEIRRESIKQLQKK